jgi:NitT/TauT family transport system permease protein
MLRQSSPVSVQSGKPRAGHRGLSLYDIVAAALILAGILALADASLHMLAPLAAENQPVSLSPWALPLYALRSTMRMLAAMVASLVFTFVFASLAAKSRRAETILVPMLDILQSVPVLGFISITVTAFMALAPGHALGAELAAIFAIFTSQAWNMAFSFYQSLKTIPEDLKEAARSLRMSAWMRFWRLEVPFAAPALIWNMMMSMSGGWFFVVACEAISVGPTHIMLPGVGSYIATAVAERNLTAILWAIGVMLAVILAYDQLLFRPLVAWSHRFRAGEEDEVALSRPWLLDVLQRSSLVDWATRPLLTAFDRSLRWSRLPDLYAVPVSEPGGRRPIGDRLWNAGLAAIGVVMVLYCAHYLFRSFPPSVVLSAFLLGLPTLVRVLVLIALASLIWVPVGVYVGLRPKLAAAVQPVAQMMAAFPANLVFPLVVSGIVALDLNPDVWLSPLMVLGTQWYILFNVIAGAMAIPSDLREVSTLFRFTQWQRWQTVILPGIFPYLITGLVTASGGAWNASIIAEYFHLKGQTLQTLGLGAQISSATDKGQFHILLAATIVMALMVVTVNRLVWRPLYRLAETKYKLEA